MVEDVHAREKVGVPKRQDIMNRDDQRLLARPRWEWSRAVDNVGLCATRCSIKSERVISQLSDEAVCN